MPNSSRAKHWCFTLNNYSEDELSRLSVLPEGVEYLVFGKETGESGTPHLQGYISFSSRKRFAQVKVVVGSRAHLEAAKGSPESNRSYCTKDGEFVELGTCPRGQGARSDLDKLQSDISSGASFEAIQSEHFALYLRYSRSIDRLIMRSSTRRDWLTEVFVFHGQTGTGKTRRVHEKETPAQLYVHPGGAWFDGYESQEAVLFDDFGGSEFKLTYLLKLLDRYPMCVPVKGGFVNWNPKRVYITSNLNPEDWYPNAYDQHRAALRRRIKEVVLFESE